MNKINGFTFLMDKSDIQGFADARAKESLRLLKEVTKANTVAIAFGALQDTPFSEEIDYSGEHMPTDDEVIAMIDYAHSLGFRVFLKPMVNCKDGTWRARIDFFDVEAPCETKWSGWFKHYNEYIGHYAEIAEATGCEMLIIGCELVQTERKEEYWRKLIDEVRGVYKGLLTYNTDKYQEDNVKWWDALDVISSSGYYPIDAWEENLNRIKQVVDKFGKPFFFAECGTPCRKGSSFIPNDWTYKGELAQEEQAEYYRVMFDACRKYSFVEGFVGWAWYAILPEEPSIDDGYAVYGKPAAKVIGENYGI